MDAEPWILVTEASDAHAHMARRALEEAGIAGEVRCIADGERAVDLLIDASWRHTLPTLAVIEVTLPGIDGLDTLRILHARGVTSEVPIVMTSRVSSAALTERCLSLGARAYVLSSSPMQAWVDAIREAVGRGAGRYNAGHEEASA